MKIGHMSNQSILTQILLLDFLFLQKLFKNLEKFQYTAAFILCKLSFVFLFCHIFLLVP